MGLSRPSALFFQVPRGFAVRVLDSLNDPVSYILRRNILPQLVTNRRHPLLHTSNMPISQLRLRHVQNSSENRQVRGYKNATVVEDGSPSDTSRGTRNLLPFDLNIVDWLKLGVYPETSQSFDGTLR